jgi:hypothetical protein
MMLALLVLVMSGLFATSTAEDCCLSLGNFGLPYCYSVDTGTGSGGPPGSAGSPGAFTDSETWRSTVQPTHNGYNDMYHGQLVISVNHPIDSFTYLLSGTEICEGNPKPGWHETASLADWQSINITDGHIGTVTRWIAGHSSWLIYFNGSTRGH